MRFPNDLTLGGVIATALEEAKRKYGLSTEDIAVMIDYSRHMLYKVADLKDPSSLPLSKLIPFINATKNNNILKFIARHCGYIVFKIPNGNHLEDMTELQKLLTRTISALFKYWNDELSLEEVKIYIDEGIGGLAGIRKACEKRNSKQGELEIED